MLLRFSKKEKSSLCKFPVFFFGPYLSCTSVPCSFCLSPSHVILSQVPLQPSSASGFSIRGELESTFPSKIKCWLALILCRSCTGAHYCRKFISAVVLPCPKRFLSTLSMEDIFSGWLSLPVCMWSAGWDCREVLLSARKKYCTFSSPSFYMFATRRHWFVKKLSSILTGI